MKRLVFFLILLVLLLLNFRVFLEQKRLIEEAKRAQEPIKAIRYYEKALLFYHPLSPYNKAIVEGILDRCDSIEGDEQKLYCYETLRSCLYQIKSLYLPYKETVERIEPIIADLKARQMINWKYNGYTEKDYHKLYNYQLQILKSNLYPSDFWSVVSVFSLLGWISSVVVLIFRGFTTPINRKYVAFSLLSGIIFFILWIIGTYRA